MSILSYNITNPGLYISGILTGPEQQFVTDLVSLTYAQGDILYHDGTQLTNLAIGTTGEVLTVSAGGIPEWDAAGSGGGTWGTITGTLSDQTDLQTALNGKQATITAGALTKVDDTNVTITLGGTPTTALLQATSLTLGWSGQLSLARGGTGANLSDPGADRILFWDDSDGAVEWLEIGTGLTITGNTLDATGGGGGGMTSFTLDADTGTPQTIADGNTLDIAGGTGIDTVVGATDTVTVNLDAATVASLALADSSVQNLSDLGITADATELNYVDGVTSAIQTQLNAKQAQDAFLDDIATLTDPGADRILFWDDSDGEIQWLEIGSGLSITGDILSATGGGGSPGGSDTQLQYNNASSFGGISGATTNGTAITVTSNNLVVGNLLASSNDSGALGASGTAFSDLFLASGAVIGFNNGDVNITHSSNNLIFTGASSGYSFDAQVIGASFVPTLSTVPSNGLYISGANTLGWSTNTTARMNLTTTALSPAADGGISLGTTALGWQNLFGNTGFVINLENGNWVATHTSGILTVGTGDLRVTTAGTNTASVVTVGGTQTLTNKTLTTPQINDTSSDHQYIFAVSELAADRTVTLPLLGANDTFVFEAFAQTLTNKRITKRTGTTTSSATPTINTDNVDEYYITAQTTDITSFTTNLSGTPTLGQGLFISVIGTAARAITWGASFANGPVALPTTTVTTTQLSVFFKWDGSIWRCYATGSTV